MVRMLLGRRVASRVATGTQAPASMICAALYHQGLCLNYSQATRATAFVQLFRSDPQEEHPRKGRESRDALPGESGCFTRRIGMLCRESQDASLGESGCFARRIGMLHREKPTPSQVPTQNTPFSIVLLVPAAPTENKHSCTKTSGKAGSKSSQTHGSSSPGSNFRFS